MLAADEGAARLRQPAGGLVSRPCARALLELLAQPLQLLAALERPVLVAVLGEQRAAVEGERGAERGGRAVAPRLIGGGLEGVDVDARVEHQELVAQLDRRRAEDAPRCVHDLVEVVRGRRRFAVRPQRVHQLLAVQAVARGEREQLDEVPSLAQPPADIRQRLAVDRDGEAAEQRDGYVVGRRIRVRPVC